DVCKVFRPPLVDYAAAHETEHHRAERDGPRDRIAEHFPDHGREHAGAGDVIARVVTRIELVADVLRRVSDHERARDEEREQARGGYPEHPLPGELAEDARHALEREQQAESDQNPEDAREGAALAHVEPRGIDLYDREGAERLEVEVDRPRHGKERD